MKYRIALACLAVFTCGWTATAAAQDATSEPTEQTTTAAADAAPSRMARTIAWAEREFGGGAPRDGFYPEFDGLISGSGLTIGPGYRHHIFGDRALVDASAAVSWRRYSMVQSTIQWPRLLEDHLALGGQVKFQDFTQVNYFGIGNDTAKSDQTDYRIKYVDVAGFAAVRPMPWLTVSGRIGGMRRADVSSGLSTIHPSIEERFNDASAPALIVQPNYVHADLGVEADTRDKPGYPSRGGRYRASFAAFHDGNFDTYSFRRVEADAVQYVPVNDWSVLAVRGRLDATQTTDDQHVPFYMLPALGNSQSLRGYSDFRFRDRNAAFVTAEYRWRLSRVLDGAVFSDAGTVAPTAGSLFHRGVHADYGLGLRVHTNAHLIARLDVARSREGLNAIVSFTPALGSSKRVVAPYVP